MHREEGKIELIDLNSLSPRFIIDSGVLSMPFYSKDFNTGNYNYQYLRSNNGLDRAFNPSCL